LWLSFRHASVDSFAPQPAGPAKKTMWRLLACAAMMGASLMALEVVWFRFLSMFAVASTLAVSLMLAVVLAAIALGGLLASRWLEQRPDATGYLSAVAWIASGSVVGAYRSFRFLTGSTWAAEWPRILWSAIVLTSATAMLSGMAFVLLGAALNRLGANSRSASAGWLTLANTTGGMLGPLVAAFALLPRAGMERSFFLLSVGYAVVGILAMRLEPRGSRPASSRYWSVATAIGAAAALALFPFGLMEDTYFPRATAAYQEDGARVVASREGMSETIHLLAKSWLDKPLYYRLVTNGFSMSGTHTSGKRYMRYFAYWPMLLHQTPLHRALIVCYGAGVTASAVADVKSIDSIDVVEISPDIPSMSRIIYAPGDHPLRDPRVRLHIEDGRYFLQATADRFDLITGEPPPPLTPGTVSLYTREYFQLMRDHLAEGGIVTYWLPVAKRGEYDVKAIIAAFCDVFDDCSLWNGTVFDWMLVGTRQLKGPVSDVNFSAAWRDPGLSPKLREIGFETPQQIGATFLADAGDLRQLARGAFPITDNYPQRLQPAATRLSLERGPTTVDQEMHEFVTHVVDPARARLAFERSGLIHRLWPEDLALQTLPFFDVQAAINRVMFEGARPLAHIEDLHTLLTSTTLREAPLWMLGSDEAQQNAAASGNDGSGMVEYVLGLRALATRDYDVAVQRFLQAERLQLPLPMIRPLTVYALCLSGRMDVAQRLAEGVKPESADQRHFWTWLASTFKVRARLNPEVGER
jgi:spermidine synthase